MEQQATIHLERKHAYSDLLRSYNIFIDDEQVGTIRHGERRSFQVHSGHHDIFLTLDWCSSQHISIDTVPDEEVKLICQGKNPLFALYNISFGSKRYIKLYRGLSIN